MAERKNTGKRYGQRKSSGKNQMPLAAVFWLVFFTIVTGLFLANRETIAKNFDLLTRRLGISMGKKPAAEDKPEPAHSTDDSGASISGTLPVQSPARPADQSSGQTAPGAQPPAAQPSTAQPATAQPPAAPASSVTQPTQPPVAQPAASQPPVNQPSVQPDARPTETRARSVYYTQVDKDGIIHNSKTTRTVPLSDSPMQDSLNALLAGPTTEEQRRGLLNLIPANARILSCTVRGSTAYINFSEDFLYNTYGVEGYAAQLRQIIWTATEFPTVKDVQILIEGRRIDYLGEGIWIGSPVNRESL